MKEKRYKFFTITEGSLRVAGKPIFAITNNRGMYSLGTIGWHPGWKQYVFRPQDDTEWSEDCHADIGKFLHELNKEAKV